MRGEPTVASRPRGEHPGIRPGAAGAGSWAWLARGAQRKEIERAERRQRDVDGVEPAVGRDRAGGDPADVSVIATAEGRTVGVEDFGPGTLDRHADAIVEARHGCAIENSDETVLGIPGLAQEHVDAVVAVVGGDPFEAAAVGVELVEAGLASVEAIELADQELQLPVQG